MEDPKSDPLVELVRRTAAGEGLLRRGDRVLAAVSGGPDSLALLHVLWTLRGELGLDLAVASLDHGLRGPRGQADLDFVREEARRLGLVFYGGGVDVATLAKSLGLSLEDAARRARYDFLGEVARRWGPGPSGPPRVASGHTADDQAETVLMRVIEGTGLSGLAGMSFSREEDGWVLVRPLLRASRGDTEAYCRRWSLSPRADETNDDPRFRRNLVRTRLLPVLAEYNPRVKEALVRLADLAREEAATLERETENLERALVVPGVPAGERPFDGLEVADERVVSFSRAAFGKLREGDKRRLVRRIVEKLSGREALREMGRDGVKRAVGAAEEFRVGGRLPLPGGVVLEAGYRRVFFGVPATPGREPAPHAAAAEEPRALVELAVPGHTDAPALGWTFDTGPAPGGRRASGGGPEGPASATAAFTVVLDPSKIDWPLRVRTRRRGDAFQPAGLEGTKKLKDYFISIKLPRADRESWPLVVDAQDRVVWVVGLRADGRFVAAPGTPGALRVEARRTRRAVRQNPGGGPDG